MQGQATLLRRLRELLGPEAVSEETTSYEVDGLRPWAVVSPGDLAELSAVLSLAWAERLAVVPWGGGTRMDIGGIPRAIDLAVDLRRLNRPVQLNPADLTATVQAGCTVAELQRTLAQYGQFLAVDPPLPQRATIGGSLAVGTPGPLKWQMGLPRDLVIGMKVVQADGTITKSGGQVVKNVTGYDMARLHVGGLGTLGVIAEVSFKLTPLPPQEATLVAGFPDREAVLAAGLDIFHSHVVPLALVAFDRAANRRTRASRADNPWLLAVRVGGGPRAVDRQIRECTATVRRRGASHIHTLNGDDAAHLWRRLADFGWDDDTRPWLLARAYALPSALEDAIAALPTTEDGEAAIITFPGFGTALLAWYGDPQEPAAVAETVLRAREALHDLDGGLVVERCPVEVKRLIDVWDRPAGPLAVMKGLKEQYDRQGVLNPGRFVGGI